MLPYNYEDYNMFFRSRSQNETKKSQTDNESSDKNKEAFRLGSSIAKLITSSWNSQENPGKVYIFNRRVHHGGVGALLGLSNFFSKSQPIPSGILSGLGEGLAKDDYADRDSWFTFDKKPESSVHVDDGSVPQTTTTSSVSSTTINSSNIDYSTNNEMHQETKSPTIEKTKESS
jgi:hypothetical protein